MANAVIVVDMLKDNLKESPRNPYLQGGKTILPNLQRLLDKSRKRGFPIIDLPKGREGSLQVVVNFLKHGDEVPLGGHSFKIFQRRGHHV